ncbi:MAG: hypothetical protein JXO48_02580 [Deltaproteobacteria bacterium]|nr:hypothetical protein [Deltaproteobacteria bacterium]
MRLKDVKWENGKGAEDVVLWGIAPMKWLIDMFDGHEVDGAVEVDEEKVMWLFYELKNKLDDLEEYLLMVGDKAHGRERFGEAS